MLSVDNINERLYSLGLPIPSGALTDPNDEELIRSVMLVLEGRIAKRRCLQQQFKLQSKLNIYSNRRISCNLSVSS